MKATKTHIPLQSVVQSSLNNADFYDAYEVVNPQPSQDAMQTWLDAIRKIPRWIERAMDLRNGVVAQLGLKNLGNLSSVDAEKMAQDYQVGDRVGIFTVRHISPTEVVMGDNDKHLDARLSLCKIDGNKVVVSTVVHIHNWFGTVYMFFVKPMHRIIAPAVLSKI